MRGAGVLSLHFERFKVPSRLQKPPQKPKQVLNHQRACQRCHVTTHQKQVTIIIAASKLGCQAAATNRWQEHGSIAARRNQLEDLRRVGYQPGVGGEGDCSAGWLVGWLCDGEGVWRRKGLYKGWSARIIDKQVSGCMFKLVCSSSQTASRRLPDSAYVARVDARVSVDQSFMHTLRTRGQQLGTAEEGLRGLEWNMCRERQAGTAGTNTFSEGVLV